MFKKFAAVFLLALAVGWASAQTTVAVTATVADSNSHTWYNATCAVSFVTTPSQPDPTKYTNGGVAVTTPTCSYTATTGAMSFTVGDNTAISPLGSMWRVSVCPQVYNAPCQSYTFVASGGSMNISAALTAAFTPPTVQASGQMFGYATDEIVGTPFPGAFFTIVGSGSTTCNNYLSGAWVACTNAATYVATIPITTYSSTTSIALATFYTTPASPAIAQYRMCVYGILTVGATAGSYTAIAAFTIGGHVVSGRQFGTSIGNAQWGDNSGGSAAPTCGVFLADAATNIQFGLTSTATGSPTIKYAVTLEKLQ